MDKTGDYCQRRCVALAAAAAADAGRAEVVVELADAAAGNAEPARAGQPLIAPARRVARPEGLRLQLPFQPGLEFRPRAIAQSLEIQLPQPT